MTEAEWKSWRKLGENKSMDGFFGFGLAQNYSCLIKVCEGFLTKLNLSLFSTKRRLRTIIKDAETDSKDIMSRFYEAIWGMIQLWWKKIEILELYS